MFYMKEEIFTIAASFYEWISQICFINKLIPIHLHREDLV